MNARKLYFDDLLNDCFDAADAAEVPEEHQPAIVAALILSDSLNGLRKAMVQAASLRDGGGL
jgi:hypothetical protein